MRKLQITEIEEIENWVLFFTFAWAEPKGFDEIVEEILGLGHGFLWILDQPIKEFTENDGRDLKVMYWDFVLSEFVG